MENVLTIVRRYVYILTHLANLTKVDYVRGLMWWNFTRPDGFDAIPIRIDEFVWATAMFAVLAVIVINIVCDIVRHRKAIWMWIHTAFCVTMLGMSTTELTNGECA